MGVPAVQELKKLAVIIRQHQADTCHSLWEIAARLKEARGLFPEKKPVIGGKSWSAWTEAEIGLTGKTATRMIRTYEKFNGAPARHKVAFTTLVELASPNTPEALIAEVLEEAEADRPPTRQEVRIRKKGTLPSPREAREQALASGEYVQASDGRQYAPITVAKQAEIDCRRTLVYEFRDAVEHIADMAVTPEEWLARAADHQTYTPDDIGDIARARDYLAAFIEAFNKLGKPILEAVK